MGYMLVIIILVILCLCSNKLNAVIEIGMALVIIFGVIYGIKFIFDVSWLKMFYGIIIFCLGAYLWERIK